MPSTPTLLIVDDDKFFLDMYRKNFEKHGLQVDIAVGSSEALGKLREGAKPDILVLDVIMPGIDGLEMLASIREEKLCENACVIILTNESDKDKIKRAHELDVDGYIVKATSIPSELVAEVLKLAENAKK